MISYYRPPFERSFGTWPLKGAELAQAIRDAVEVGYRAFDTAQGYANEAEVGAALAACGVPREELFITTKVAPRNFAEADFLPSVEASIAALGGTPVDVLLLHWPPADGQIAAPLRLLQQAHRRGLAKAIGVSNFTSAMLREAVRTIDTPLVTNQVEFHPLLNQDILLAASAEVGVPLSSYCSVARGEIFRVPDFAEIGETYGVSAAQVALRWILQKGVSINTMSTKRKNIEANFAVMHFTLSNVDMARIDRLTQRNYRIVDKASVPTAPDFD